MTPEQWLTALLVGAVLGTTLYFTGKILLTGLEYLINHIWIVFAAIGLVLAYAYLA